MDIISPLWKTSDLWYNKQIEKLGVEDEHSTITLCCGYCQQWYFP